MHEAFPARPVGRPKDPTKAEAVLAASWQLFLEHGVGAVTLDAIASAAGVSKGTLYTHFPDKRALFAEGVRREMARIEAAQAAPAGQTSDEPPTLRGALIAFGLGLMHFLASDAAVRFYGNLSGELRRDPELAQLFWNAGPGRTQQNLTALLASPLAAELAIDDPQAAAAALFGMWQGFSAMQLALGIDREGASRSIPARVERGVTLFMRAYARPD